MAAGWTHDHVEANGIRVHHVRQGSGEPLVLLHGWPEFWYMWRKNIGPLAEAFDAVVPDLRGFGGTEKKPLPDPPGRHDKRWQDVETLLQQGIDVITTVNVQHLESLNDVVFAITGVRQAETVPDAVVRAAETVELVDMSPQALRRRMAHGNIYPAEKIDKARPR